MEKEELLVILKRIYSNQFTPQEGLDLISQYIFERKQQRVKNLVLSVFDTELYERAIRHIVFYYEQKFDILKVFNKDNQLVLVI